MYIDRLLVFCTNQAITATAPSTDTIDVTNGRDLGVGTCLKINLLCTTAFVGAGATLTAQFQGSLDNVTWMTIDETRQFAAATDLASTGRLRGLAVESSGYFYRYYRINFVVTGGPFTAGAVSAQMVLDREEAPTYPTNI